MVGSLTPNESMRLRMVSIACVTALFFRSDLIVHAWQLHQNLILAEAVLLNGWLAHTQRINAVADGFNRLRNCLILQIAEDLGLHGKRPAVVRAGSKVVLRQALVCDIQEIF